MIRRALPALALVVYILATGGCLGLVDRPAACPDGSEPTEWCGCEAPVYGDDC